jgi:hypothetical protein
MPLMTDGVPRGPAESYGSRSTGYFFLSGSRSFGLFGLRCSLHSSLTLVPVDGAYAPVMYCARPGFPFGITELLGHGCRWMPVSSTASKSKPTLGDLSLDGRLARSISSSRSCFLKKPLF